MASLFEKIGFRIFEPDFCGSEYLGRSDPTNLIVFVVYTCKRCISNTSQKPVRSQSETSPRKSARLVRNQSEIPHNTHTDTHTQIQLQQQQQHTQTHQKPNQTRNKKELPHPTFPFHGTRSPTHGWPHLGNLVPPAGGWPQVGDLVGGIRIFEGGWPRLCYYNFVIKSCIP